MPCRTASVLRVEADLNRIDATFRSRYVTPMAKDIPSVGDLRRKSLVTDAEIDAATDAFLRDPKAEPFAFASGHRIDVAKAIEMHPQAKAAMTEVDRPNWRRTIVRTAVIMGFPVEG